MIRDEDILAAPSFPFRRDDGGTWNVKFIADRHDGGSAYAVAFCNDPVGGGYLDNYAIASANIPDEPKNDACIWCDIRTMGEGFQNWLEEHGLAVWTGRVADGPYGSKIPEMEISPTVFVGEATM